MMLPFSAPPGTTIFVGGPLAQQPLCPQGDPLLVNGLPVSCSITQVLAVSFSSLKDNGCPAAGYVCNVVNSGDAYCCPDPRARSFFSNLQAPSVSPQRLSAHVPPGQWLPPTRSDMPTTRQRTPVSRSASTAVGGISTTSPRGLSARIFAVTRATICCCRNRKCSINRREFE